MCGPQRSYGLWGFFYAPDFGRAAPLRYASGFPLYLLPSPRRVSRMPLQSLTQASLGRLQDVIPQASRLYGGGDYRNW